MDPVQALAILSLGAFVTVLVTAIFYTFTVRPRLLEPVSLANTGLLDESLREELLEQRAAVGALNQALAQHTARLEEVAGAGGGDVLAGLHEMLGAQHETVTATNRLLAAQGERLDRLDLRLDRQETHLGQLESALQRALPAPGAETAETAPLQEQVARLADLSNRLDEWGAGRARDHAQVAEHARILAELDRELAAQVQAVTRLDERVAEHTTMLLTAATERRQQAGLLDRAARQIGQLVEMVTQLGAVPLRPGQDRLTEIKGIGPVYAGRLYKAGVQTFAQLASMTPAELYRLLDEPKWRLRAIDAESWIRQAAEHAAPGEKDERAP
ncbi:MAG: DUF4332 domain-containing protein [Anaerolineae bacterium]|nr:DUF4332 domain-containing protein [Anaerolineae bacterium]